MKEFPKKELVFSDIALPSIIPNNPDYLSHDPFYGPSEFPLTLQLPEFYFALIIVRSEEVLLTCIDDYTGGDIDVIGEDVLIASGLYTYQVYPSDVPNISNLEMKTLAALPQTVLDLMVGKSADELQEAPYLLKEPTALALSATLQTTQAALNATAKIRATSLLVCYWENSEVRVECPPTPTGYVNEASITQAGVVRSIVSQQDAQDQAIALAQAKLYCLQGNAEVVIDCYELYPPQEVDPDPDPELPPVLNPYRDVQGDPVVIAKNTFTAETLEEANLLAYNYALSKLDCYWSNPNRTASCELDVLDSYTAVELDERTVVITDASETSTIQRGLVVKIQEGVFISKTSKDDAIATADAVAESLLDCKWENVEMETYACDWYREDGKKIPPGVCDETTGTCYTLDTIPECDIPDFTCIPKWTSNVTCYVYGDVKEDPEDACALLDTVPEPLYVPESSCVPVDPNVGRTDTLYRVVKAENFEDLVIIPRGYAMSYLSQEDANNMAREKKSLEQECIYCNVKISGVCAPPGLVPGFDAETGKYPDGSSVQPPFDEWSMDATLGIEAKQICGPDYLAVLAQASGMAVRTYESKRAEEEKCRYGNEQLYVACITSTHPSGDRIHGKYDELGIPQNPDGSQAGPRLSNTPELSIDWRFAFPAKDGYITVPRNTFIATKATSGGKEPRNFANQLALAYGLTIINCPVREF